MEILIQNFQMYLICLKKYNEYMTMVSNGTMHIDSNSYYEFLANANYLINQLNKKKNVISKEDYIRYAMFLEQYTENLSNHIKIFLRLHQFFVNKTKGLCCKLFYVYFNRLFL